MAKFYLRSSLILMVFVFSFLTLNAQEKQDYTKLDQYIKKAVKNFEIPGLAIGIIKNNEVVFLETYGYRNNETKKKVNENTIFGIASCSKAFTAACVAILVDDGKLNWDDKVIDHYPGFKVYDPYITSEMTIRDLLCHRSGYQTFDGDLLWYGTDYSRAEVVERLSKRENPYSFREKFGYSNVMYIAAGEVIERVSGLSWDEFVNERIINPLEMNRTVTTNAGFNKAMNVAWPHLDGEPLEFLNYDNAGPAASINTSVSDLLKWAQLMLNKGQWNDSSVFSTKQYYQLVSPQTMLNAGSAEKVGGTHFSVYGLGWFMKDHKSRKIIQHGGGIPGFHSKVIFVPEDSLGYVILANELSLLVPALDKEILDFHLNDSITGYASKYLEYKIKQNENEEAKLKQLEEERIKGTKPSLALEQYTGIYEDEMYGEAEIKLLEGKLNLTLLPAKDLFTTDLEHWHYDTFRVKLNDPFLPAGFVTFQLGEDGSIEGFKINIENPDFHFYKLEFIKKDE